MTKSRSETKNVAYVGGESNADLIFQLAIDTINGEIDWEQIASIVGEPVTAEKAMKWFSAITTSNKKTRWSSNETAILEHLVFQPTPARTKELSEIFSHRSRKAITLKISRLNKARKNSP